MNIGQTTTANPGAIVPAALMNLDEECERMYQDFADDISLTRDELKIFVAWPELSIAGAKKLVAEAT